MSPELVNLTRVLAARYGTAEGYGSLFGPGGKELYGHSWRALDLCLMFSFSCERDIATGIVTTVYKSYEIDPTDENWLRVFREQWPEKASADEVRAAAAAVRSGTYVGKEAA